MKRLVLSFALAGCAGGTFVIEAPLRDTPALEVKGPLGSYTQSCDQKAPKTSVGLRGDKATGADVGPWSIVTSEPHREITSDALLGDRVLHDYETFAAHTREAAALAHAFTGGPPVAEILAGVHAVLDLPDRIEQTMTFTVLATRDDRAVLGVCRATDVVHFMGSFDRPHTSLGCRFVPASDKIARDLKVAGYGSWANFAFKGSLDGPAADEHAIFESQNIVVLGAGGVRGFDLRRTAPPSDQLAAISFFQDKVGEKTVARAWLDPKATSPWSDVVAAVTAFAYVFPWPTSCDSYQLRGEAAGAR